MDQLAQSSFKTDKDEQVAPMAPLEGSKLEKVEAMKDASIQDSFQNKRELKVKSKAKCDSMGSRERKLEA